MSAFEDVVEAWGFKIAGDKPAVLSPAGIAPDGTIVYSDAESFLDLIGAEPELGNPSVNGWILSSSSAGVRSWVAPNAHTHAIADVAGLQTALDARMSTASYPDLVAIESLAGTSGLLRKTAANTWSLDTASYALSSAIPAASSTTPSALGTAAVGTGTTWARADHVHAMPTAAQVGAAASAHSHAIADVTGLQSALDAKMSTASYPDLVAIEALAGTSGLLRKTAANTWSLDTASYALSSAIPVASSTTPSALGTAAVGTGTTWARADHVHAMPTAAQVGAAASAHSHAIADVTGLQSALDAKMSTASYPDLVAIEALAGTSGLLRKTAANTWSLDTANYPTGAGSSGNVAWWNSSSNLTGNSGMTYDGATLTVGGTGSAIYGKIGATRLAGNLDPAAFTMPGFTGNLIGWNRSVGGQRMDFYSSVEDAGHAHGFSWWSSVNGEIARLDQSGGLSLLKLNASTFPYLDGSKTIVSRTAAEMRTLLNVPSGVDAVVKNPTATQLIVGYALGLQRSSATNYALQTIADGDTNLRFVIRADGTQLYGPGTATTDVTFGRAAVGAMGTNGAMRAVDGFRSTGYDASPWASNGPGIEMHYAGTVGRVLAYDRTTSLRIGLDLDGSPIRFMANGVLKGSFGASGDFNLVNATASRVAVFDASKNLVSGSMPSSYLDATSSIQDQFDGKWTRLDTRITDDCNNAGALNRITDVAGSALNNPGSFISYLLNIRNNYASTTYQAQLAVTGGTAPKLAVRNNWNSAWTSWKYALLDTDNPDLVAIEALAGTSGFLKKIGANAWALDTASYWSTTNFTATDISNWDAAYAHSQISLGNPHGTTFAQLASKPTTLSGYGITDAPSLNGNNSFSGINTFDGATILNGGGTWNGSLLNRYSSGWDGKFGFEGNPGISTSALFHRPSNLEALALTLYNPSNSSDSKRVFTVSCNDDSPNTAPVTVAFDVPVSLPSGSALAGTVTGRVVLSGTSLLDISVSDTTLPDAPLGTMVIAFNTGTNDRRIYSSSGTLIINQDILGNTYEQTNILVNRGGWLLVRVTSTRWVAIGAV